MTDHKITVGEILEHEFRNPENNISGQQQARIKNSVLATTGLRLESEFNKGSPNDDLVVSKIRQIAVDAIRRDIDGAFKHDRQ